MQNIKH